jgi:hypothetical protein
MLLSAAVALGANDVEGWSAEEQRITEKLPRIAPSEVHWLLNCIRRGQDPLGEMFCRFTAAAIRRKQGAVYTPKPIVKAMVDWAVKNHRPVRVVDPGVGSGRFIVEAGRRIRGARLLGVDVDPVAAILARGHASAAGLAERTHIMLADYRRVAIPNIDGHTLYLGNPPYVRHHEISSEWKQWLVRSAGVVGLTASQLSGLHVHFLLATALKAKPGDIGLFITSAEWLDVNYGKLARELFLGSLGGQSILIIEPTAQPFPDTATTGTIFTFQVESRPRSIQLKRIESLAKLNGIEGGRRIRRERLETERRWSHFSRGPVERREDYVELGELCRVHRGQVTGANRVWIQGPLSQGLPECVLFATVTKARELFEADRVLDSASGLRQVIDLPVDLDTLDIEARRAVECFLKIAKQMGADSGYIARYRRAWWSVGLREPAPILSTYMARRPPAFVHNVVDARHLNIAHGLYPRELLSPVVITSLVKYLSYAVRLVEGRTYSGGLTKFEPREMERVLIPNIKCLEAGEL